MLFTDLEVGDRIKIISLEGLDIRKNCCNRCDFMLKNLNKEVEVIDIIKVYNNGINVKLLGNGQVGNILIRNDEINNYKIVHITEEPI